MASGSSSVGYPSFYFFLLAFLYAVSGVDALGMLVR
jgi:hypothetical protein